MKHTSSSNVGTMNDGACETRNTQKNYLVATNLKLVESLAEYVMSRNRNCSWMTTEDLLGAGYEALVRAAYAYSPTGEASFKTYASHCILNAMVAEIRCMFPLKVPDKQRKDFSILRDEADPSDWDNPRLSVFDKYQSETMNGNWETEQESLLERLDEAMDRLKREELELVRYRYGFESEPMTLCQLAERYQKTQQAIHKRLNRVHDKLRVLVVDEASNYRLSA